MRIGQRGLAGMVDCLPELWAGAGAGAREDEGESAGGSRGGA